MSEENPATPPQQPADFTPPASQDELNRIIEQRLARERGKFADYADLQAKAKRLDEIEEQTKSETQKEREKREAAEKRAAELEVRALRATIAATKGIDPELLTGTTEEEITAAAEKLLAWRGEVTPPAAPPSTTAADAGNKGEVIGGAKQLTREDLKNMTPHEINEARKKGQLNSLMGIS